ncbi:MAG TPA: tyrosine-type recombinase/integrase [Xanthobacteraceae bacterium]|nr:tyrosine-type recombinase/integrase [Xanthobacteraceae bacterium]
MPNSVNLTKRVRKRRLKSGQVVTQTRWVLNYRDPRTRKRKQLFFERQKDAQAKRNDIITQIEIGSYADDRNKSVTIAEATERWLKNREGEVKAGTLTGYRQTASYIIGPMLIGTARQRCEFAQTGKKPEGTRLVPMLGDIKVRDLSTADIRAWHKTVAAEVGWYSANRAKMFLNAVLALAAEDLNIRPPAMPANLGRGKPKTKKPILTLDQINTLLREARADREKGIYVAFPFLAGTRPSEQLGLLWDEIDFDANVIHILRMQERDGSITDMTKTLAGTRDIPMCSLLRTMLLEWRLVCPRWSGELHRVFPGLGHRQPWPLPRVGGGGPLLYWNFRARFWVPALRSLGLPIVTPHSARHCFISTLQAQGIEVGLVAKLAGHASAVVTLGHYTQAVRGAESAVAALERAFTG